MVVAAEIVDTIWTVEMIATKTVILVMERDAVEWIPQIGMIMTVLARTMLLTDQNQESSHIL